MCRNPRSISSSPCFAGKLITTDPTEDDAALSVFNMIVQKYGWDYMDKYMAQQPALRHHRPRRGVERDRRGREARDLRFHLDHAAAQGAGKPIEPVFSQADATPVFLVGAAIFKDAPHPNAAKLYLTWYLAKEQQSRNGTFSPRADVPPPPAWRRSRPTTSTTGYRKLVSDEARLTELRKRLRRLHRAAVRMTPSLSLPGDPAIHLLTEMPSSLAKVTDPRVKPAGDG